MHQSVLYLVASKQAKVSLPAQKEEEPLGALQEFLFLRKIGGDSMS